tara:strand:+ start:269 stop:694 length:426 start_codon:yes stop_codon:yes gene_type:complete
MYPFFIIFIGLPTLEIFLLIEIGSKIGALSTISLIFLTAIVGIYFARIEGIRTIRSGIVNFYQNKVPIYEILSGASIAIAALLLIIPGFFTDIVGFLILVPLTRKFLIKSFLKKRNKSDDNKNNNILDGEIIDDKKNNEEL